MRIWGTSAAAGVEVVVAVEAAAAPANWLTKRHCILC